MRIRALVTPRVLAGFAISALAGAALAGIPSAANALPDLEVGETVNFGQVAPGQSQERTITITNEGNPNVPEDTAYGFIASIPPFIDADFAVINPFCAPGNLAGGESCNTITVRFTASSSQPTVTSTVVFVSYQQDVDPDPNVTTLQQVQKQFSVTLVANVLCAGVTPTIVGTNGDDVISGTSGNDVIAALGGEDIVQADAGNDIVCGGGSDDVLKGNTGRDTLFGDTGGDVLKGGKGRDTCIGGPGLDRGKKCERVGSL
jgi:Ca2+-binding RTX toxin-like protein